MHGIATLFSTLLAGSTIVLCQVPPTRTVCYGLALAVGLGVRFKFLNYDSLGKLGTGAASLDIA